MSRAQRVFIYSTAVPVPYASASARVPASAWQSAGMPQAALFYPPETTLGSEFSVLSDFLESLDERSFFNPPPTTVAPALMSAPPQPFTTSPQPAETSPTSNMERYANPDTTMTEVSPSAAAPVKEETVPVVLPSATKTEKFLMIAADQEPGSRNERLNRVIRSKYEAGLLKPYNYVKGYARLQRWMDSKCVTVRLSVERAALTGFHRIQRLPGIEAEDSPTALGSTTQV